MSLGDLYGFVVGDCGIDPNYFLDEMTNDEVGYLSKSHIKAYRERWEILRLQNHAVLASQSSKKIDVKDVLSFPWDNEKDNETESLQTAEAIEDAKERIKKRYNL